MQIQSRKQGFKEIVTYKKVLDINKQSYLIISLDVLWFASLCFFSSYYSCVSQLCQLGLTRFPLPKNMYWQGGAW